MNNQIKIDWRTKKISDEDLAIKLDKAVNEMFTFLGKNSKDYSLYNKTWQVIGQKIITNSLGNTHSYPEYGYVESQTKIIDSNSPFFTILKSESPKKTEQMRGWQISTSDHSQYSYYDGGIKSSISVSCRIHWTRESKSNLTKFIKRIPKKSRNKLIKLIYLYDLKEEKNFWAYERLFNRLVTRFNFKFTSWSDNESYQFQLIKPTFSIDRNRNRKINKLLRNFRK